MLLNMIATVLSPATQAKLNALIDYLVYITSGGTLLWLVIFVPFFFGSVRDDIIGALRNRARRRSRLKPSAAAAHRAVQGMLKELQQRYKALRVCVFQFHNGDSFMLSNHAWKVSCTHEEPGSNIACVQLKNQCLPASMFIDWVDPILNPKSPTDGVKLIDTCANETIAAACPFGKKGHYILHFDVEAMAISNGQMLAREQGITHAFIVNLIDPKTKLTFGFLSVQFGETYTEVPVVGPRDFCVMCPIADKIQFHLGNTYGGIYGEKPTMWRRFLTSIS